jgi:hypothetical protein
VATKRGDISGNANGPAEKDRSGHHQRTFNMSTYKIHALGDYPRAILSPPGLGTNWADWSNAMGREMYLRRALEKLNLEYPPTSDD